MDEMNIVVKGIMYGLSIGLGLVAFAFVVALGTKFINWWNE